MASMVTAEQSKGPRQRETRLEALRRHTADYGGNTTHPQWGLLLLKFALRIGLTIFTQISRDFRVLV